MVMNAFRLSALAMAMLFANALHGQVLDNNLAGNSMPAIENELHLFDSRALAAPNDIFVVQRFEHTTESIFDKMANVNMPGKSYFLNINLGPSKIVNQDISDLNWQASNNMGYRVEFGYYKKSRSMPLLAYGLGLDISSYGTEISIGSLRDTLPGLLDLPEVFPRDMLEKRVEMRNLVEETQLIYLSVPLFLELGNANIDKTGYFLRFGVKVSTPISDAFSGSGSYNVKGYYPDYGLEISGVPELGFVSNAGMYTGDPMYELSPFVFSGFLSAGLTRPIANSWIARIGAQYIHGFNDVSKNNNSNGDLNINKNHLLENTTSVTNTRLFGIELGIQYVITIY